MGSWVIHKQNGTTRATVKRLEYHGKLMDERYLTVDVESPEQIGFSAGDYVIYRSEKFSIRNIADVQKCARPQSYGGAFVYKDIKLVSQGWQELTDTEMTDYAFGDNRLHYTGLGSFSFYMSKVSDMAYRVQEVLNNKYTVNNIHTWTVLIGGNTLPLSPSNENLDALDDAKAISISAGTTVKETLDLLWQNWGITYKVYSTYSSSEEMWFHYVDMRPVSEGSIPLEYGKGNGLRKVTRKLNPNVDICTRVRAYGSERNMPYRWYNNTYNDVNEAMYIPQLMLPHAMAYYDSDGHYCDENGNLYTSLPENGGAANPWATPNDVVLENVVKSAIYGKRDKEVHWNSDEMGEIFPSMKGMMYGEVAAVVDNYHAITYGDVNPDTTTGRLDQILDFEWASGDSGSSDPSDLTTGKINFYVYIPNPGFNPISNNTSENVELLMQSGMCQSRGFIIISCEGLDSNRRASTDDGFSGTITQYKLTCAKITDGEIDQVFPNSTYDIEGGETFVFTGLEYNGDYFGDTWLSVYVAAAERRLLKAAAIWLRQHSTENFIYELELDNIYLKNHTDVETALREGAMIQIPDNEFGTTVYEIIDSLTITEGKEAIPTYEITLLRRDESESLGDRVKGLVGQTISASSEIAKANDSLARKVNVANLMELLTPLAADGTTAIAWNQATLQNTHYLRANVDFFGVSGVSALGIGSGGGGGSASLNALLASLNGSTIGNVAPTIYEDGKCPVWIQTTENNGHWEWGTTGGEGGGVTLREPLSSINSASLGTPTESGQVITWNGSHWIYAIPQGGGDDDDDTYLENITYWGDNENDSTYLENIVYWGNSEDDASFLNNITYWGKSGGSTPSYSFDEAAMWAALGTNESTKIIDDSHISATIRNGAAAGATAIQQSDLTTALGRYYTKTEANGLFVHLTGNVNEIITGVKTFSNDIVATRIKIGNAYISYNSNGLCIDDGNGGSMNLYATGGVSSLGISSSGGGSVLLNDPLDSINNDLDANPSGSNKILYYNGETWGYTDLPTGGSGEGISLNDVWTSLSAANSSNKIHNSHLPDTINVATALHVNKYGYLENSNNVRFYLPNPQDTSVNYTLATTADIQNVDLTGYATESWVEGKNYLTGNQTITLSGDVSGSGTTSISVQIGTGKVTNDMLYGNIANNKLEHYSIAIAGETVTLGGSISASTLLTKVQSDFDGRYVTLGTSPQTISATKTFSARQNMFGINLDPNGDIRETLPNNGGTFYLGYNAGGGTGFNLSYSSDNVNYTYLISGLSNGNVGVGNRAPEYKFDVSGNIHTNSAYYLDSKLMADSNNGLNIGYGFAAATTPLSTTIWGEGISFRSVGGTYGGCTKIDDTHGNITYGIMGTDFIGVTNKFRFEYDSNNNTVWVLKADGTAVHFASLGGVSSLGISSSGTPNISSMNIATLTATTATATTLNVSTINPTSSEINILTPDQDGGYVTFNCEKDGEEYYFTDFYNVGLFGEDNNGETWSIEPDGSSVFASSNIGSLKVGSNGSYISRMYWDGTYLQVTVGGAIRYFKPETI